MRRTSIIIVFIILFSGCRYYLPDPCCPSPPSVGSINPPIDPIVPDPCQPLALSDLIDIALLNSPTTRSSWFQAKQAAAELGVARGDYLPSIFLRGYWLKDQIPQLSFDDCILFRERDLGFQISTSYLLFDFGGRNGNLLASTAALNSLCWQYNWQIQNVMIGVIQSYYNSCNALGNLAAIEASVSDNLRTVEAAGALRGTGVVTLADELQAKTSLIQSQILLEQQKAILHIARATLVRSLGLSPEIPLCPLDLPETIAADAICEDMERILQLANVQRADLKAMRATILENRFLIKSAKSALLPTLSTDLSYGKDKINEHAFLDGYLVRFNLNIPLFNSFADINQLRAAQAALLQSQADLEDEELSAYLAVLSDYYELAANRQILKHSYVYLEIASENQTVAFANYQTGVATIMDLMTANQALYLARQQLVDAKTNFLASLANFAFDTGCITQWSSP